jgi:hypothetical protein
MTLASREFEELGRDVTTEDLARFARTLVRSLPQLETTLTELESVRALAAEVTSLTGAGMGALSDGLAGAESKGYFRFARGGARVAERVVESFDEADLAALGENIVLILTTVKEMTQPEVMQLLRRTVSTVTEDDAGPPPSTLALLRQLRDPQVRRGLDRVLTMLRGVGATHHPSPVSASPKE